MKEQTTPRPSQKKNTRLWVLADQAIVSGGNFMTVALCARLLSVEEQGLLGYALSWYIATTILSMTWIMQPASVEAPKRDDKKLYLRQLAQVQILAAPIAALAIAGVALGIKTFGAFQLSQRELLVLAGFLLTQQLSDFRRRSAYIFATAARAVFASAITFGLRLGFLLLLRPTELYGVLVILCLAASPIATLTIVYALGNFSPRVAIRTLRRHVAQAKWFMATGPLIWLWSFLPVFLLGSMAGDSAVGVFITVRSIAGVAGIFMEILETQVAARMGREVAQGDHSMFQTLQRVRALGLVLWMIGLCGCVLGGEYVLGLIFGEGYVHNSSLLIALWTANGAIFMYRLEAVRQRTLGAAKNVAVAYAIATLTLLLLAPLFIPNYGALGAGVLLISGSLALYFAQRVIVRVQANLDMPSKANSV